MARRGAVGRGAHLSRLRFQAGTGRAPFVAVDDVSFTVARGTTHALVGESGSGKTTTGRSIAGFNRPTSGTIRVGETDVTALRSAASRPW